MSLPPLLRVLLVEDEPADALLVERHLHTASPSDPGIALERVETLESALKRLAQRDIDVVLLDLHLPDAHDLPTLVRMREADAEVPIVVLTGSQDEENALRALHAGAQDWVAKDELSGPRLRRSMRHAVERRRLEEEKSSLELRLREAEKAESLRSLAGGAAAAFGDLVRNILDASDRATLGLGSSRRSGPVQSELASIRREATRAGEMAGQLRDYAEAGGSSRVPIDLSAFVVQASELLESLLSQRATLQYELPGDLPRVLGDPTRLRQVLVALVMNARDAIGGAAGAIYVKTGAIEATSPMLAGCRADPALAEGRYAYVRIEDTGADPGSELPPRIFEPFFTTKLARRGLGLAAAQGIVRLHAGAIHAERTSEDRTAFTVLLPCIPEAETRPRTARPRVTAADGSPAARRGASSR